MAAPIAFTQQLLYLRLTTLLVVAAAAVRNADDANDANEATIRTRGGLSPPMSTVSRVQSERLARAAAAEGGARAS
jgi:hypothetical protein